MIPKKFLFCVPSDFFVIIGIVVTTSFTRIKEEGENDWGIIPRGRLPDDPYFIEGLFSKITKEIQAKKEEKWQGNVE